MATQKEKESSDYLKRHKIIELMDNLTSMLFFYRPGEWWFLFFILKSEILSHWSPPFSSALYSISMYLNNGWTAVN